MQPAGTFFICRRIPVFFDASLLNRRDNENTHRINVPRRISRLALGARRRMEVGLTRLRPRSCLPTAIIYIRSLAFSSGAHFKFTDWHSAAAIARACVRAHCPRCLHIPCTARAALVPAHTSSIRGASYLMTPVPSIRQWCTRCKCATAQRLRSRPIACDKRNGIVNRALSSHCTIFSAEADFPSSRSRSRAKFHMNQTQSKVNRNSR